MICPECMRAADLWVRVNEAKSKGGFIFEPAHPSDCDCDCQHKPAGTGQINGQAH